MNNKAVSMISLVITIFLIIIIATISSYYLSSTIDDVMFKDAKEELKNVENVVEYAKAQILIDEFMPNENWLISDLEVENKFGKILSEDEINHIKKVNKSDEIKAPYKYYLMNQSRFDAEFGNEYNVSNLRPAREYIVNYMDAFVASNYEPERLATSQNLISPGFDEDTSDNERAEINIVFTPNGNIEWAKQQATLVSINANSKAEVTSTKYLWTRSYSEPETSEFVNSIADGQVVDLDGKTGNDWYVWVLVEYKENNVDKVYKVRSEPFYIDNTAPTAELQVEEVNR